MLQNLQRSTLPIKDVETDIKDFFFLIDRQKTEKAHEY